MFLKRSWFLIIVFAGLLLLGITILYINYNHKGTNTQPNPAPLQSEITVVGKITCLPHIDTTAPQTLECAMGLIDDNGDYYSLSDNNPLYTYTNLTKYGNNQVEIKGTVTYKKDSKYQSKGIMVIKEVNLADAPKRISIKGQYLCLPLKDEDVPNTKECKYGILSNGKYYAIDFALMSQITPTLVEGNIVEASGILVPVEQLSTGFWQKYAIEGIFSVTDSIKINE